MPIIVYSKTRCIWCVELKQFLCEKGVSYEERDVIVNPSYYNEMIRKSGQRKAPTLDIAGEILPDSGKDEVEAYLLAKGMLLA